MIKLQIVRIRRLEIGLDQNYIYAGDQTQWIKKFINTQISPRCLSILKTKSKCVLGIQPMHDIYRDDHLGCCFEICHILKRNPQDLKKYLLDTVAVKILVKLVNLDQK